MLPTKVIIHHSAGKDGKTFDFSAIKRYHVEERGYLNIGYHAGVELVDDDWFVIIGRPWDMDGAHTKGQNHVALGLVFIGNFSKYEPDEEMLDVGAGMVRLWRKIYDIPVSSIHKHNEYSNTECPGALFPWTRFLLKCR